MSLTEAEECELLALREADYQERVREAWRKGDLRYKLHAAQRIIHKAVRGPEADVRDAVFLCARRFGKSFLVVVMAIEDCLQNPGSVVRIVGPEMAQTLEIVEFNLNKIVIDAPKHLICPTRYNRSWKIGSSVLVIGAFDGKNVKRNLGKEALNIYTEEAGSSKSHEFDFGMREILSPQVLHTKGRIIHATTPPFALDHCFVTEYIPLAQKAGTLFKFTIFDNPLLDEAQIGQAKADSLGEHTIAWRRNYLCEVVKDDRIVVVPAFDKVRHVKASRIPGYANWLVFGDWGGVRDCTWLGVAFYDYEHARMCVLAERWYEPNTSTSVIVAGLRELIALAPPETDLRIDAPGQLLVDLHEDHGLAVALPPKDDFPAAVNQLALAFEPAVPRITIDPSCTNLITACEFGQFNAQRTDFSRENAKLGHCDALAGLMYGWRAIDKITSPYPHRAPNPRLQFVHDDEDEAEFQTGFRTF